jgi:hypothetical protein
MRLYRLAIDDPAWDVLSLAERRSVSTGTEAELQASIYF